MEYIKIKKALYVYKDTDSIKIDNDLLNELVLLVATIGQGDCYGCHCNKFCIGSKSCDDALKKSIIDILENGISYKEE